MKKIVTIGGGTGQSRLLYYLKNYPLDITAIVSMVDNGGSTGTLRSQLNVLPPGDVRRCLLALARTNTPLQQLLNHRFTKGDLNQHTVGNILLAGLEQTQGDFAKATAVMSNWLDCAGTVLPVTLTQSTLCATLENNEIITGETNIDLPKHNPALKIKNVFLKPAVTAYPPVLSAIKTADYIVLTIGDLFTSIIPNLLVTGVADAITNSSAKLIYTCNCTTKPGETNGYSVLDYINQLEHYLTRSLDYVIANNNLNIVSPAEAVLPQANKKIILADYLADNGIASNGEKLATVLNNLCQQ
ncbi:MAG: gluconeogenesis factor YvcK family protein [Patescibacteria group bacterium]|jgi:uncharacterized cofD-like protein